jgi:hypothetical protein
VTEKMIVEIDRMRTDVQVTSQLVHHTCSLVCLISNVFLNILFVISKRTARMVAMKLHVNNPSAKTTSLHAITNDASARNGSVIKRMIVVTVPMKEIVD